MKPFRESPTAIAISTTGLWIRHTTTLEGPNQYERERYSLVRKHGVSLGSLSSECDCAESTAYLSSQYKKHKKNGRHCHEHQFGRTRSTIRRNPKNLFNKIHVYSSSGRTQGALNSSFKGPLRAGRRNPQTIAHKEGLKRYLTSFGTGKVCFSIGLASNQRRRDD